jgi:hypothetical protein
MGIISAARRQAARDEWTVMAAMAEYASRHSGTKPLDEFAADKLAFELHLTPLSAAEQMQYSTTVTTRLPKTFAALAAGRIHPLCGSSKTRPASSVRKTRPQPTSTWPRPRPG